MYLRPKQSQKYSFKNSTRNLKKSKSCPGISIKGMQYKYIRLNKPYVSTGK